MFSHHDDDYVMYMDPRMTPQLSKTYESLAAFQKCQKNKDHTVLKTCLTNVLGNNMAEDIVTDNFKPVNFKQLIEKSCQHPTGIIPCLKAELEDTVTCMTNNGVTNPAITKDGLKLIEYYITSNCNKDVDEYYNPDIYTTCGQNTVYTVKHCLADFDGAMKGLYGPELGRIFYVDRIACHGLDHYRECIEDAVATCTASNKDELQSRFRTNYNAMLRIAHCTGDISLPPHANEFEERFMQIVENRICMSLKTEDLVKMQFPKGVKLWEQTLDDVELVNLFITKLEAGQLGDFGNVVCNVHTEIEEAIDEQLLNFIHCVHNKDHIFNDKGLRGIKALLNKVCENNHALLTNLGSQAGKTCYNNNKVKIDKCRSNFRKNNIARLGEYLSTIYYDAETKHGAETFVSCVSNIIKNDCGDADLLNTFRSLVQPALAVDVTDTTSTLHIDHDHDHDHHHHGHGHNHHHHH